MALTSTPTVNPITVCRCPTLNARSPNGPNPREGRAVDSLGPTRTLVGGDSCAPTLVFCLECRVLVPPSTALSCLAAVPVVCYYYESYTCINPSLCLSDNVDTPLSTQGYTP